MWKKNVLVVVGNWDKQYDQMALIKKKRIRTCYFCIPGPLDPYSGVCMYVCMRNKYFPTRLAFLVGEVQKTKPLGQIPQGA